MTHEQLKARKEKLEIDLAAHIQAEIDKLAEETGFRINSLQVDLEEIYTLRPLSTVTKVRSVQCWLDL